MKRTAEISPCGQYRYRLGRLWDESRPVCLWIMLNPSYADDQEDDRTITLCVGYAKRWGYGSILVGNLFAWRTTYPEKLYQAEDPVGPRNDRRLRAMLTKADLVVCAWGTHRMARGREREVISMLDGRGHALRITRDGHPHHPLRLPATLTPVPYPEE